MRPSIGDFKVVRTFGDEPTVICKKAVGFRSTRYYGLCGVCNTCDFRFACATGGLYDLVGDIEKEWIEVTTFGDNKKTWIRR